MKKRAVWTAAAVAATLCAGEVRAQQPPVPALWVKKLKVRPGGRIRVWFTAHSHYPSDAWVGIVPYQVPHGRAAVNDRNQLARQALRKRTQGVLDFKAPRTPGKYDFRMNDADRNGREVASVSFEVTWAPGTVVAGTVPRVAPLPVSSHTNALRVNGTVFQPRGRITVWFTASAAFPSDAWVGIVPSRVPHGSEAVNDQHDLAYQYLGKRTSGVMIFQAPSRPGSYDLRMNDTDRNGREVASVSFSVTGLKASGQPALFLKKATFSPGQLVQVQFTAPAQYPNDAWVGIVPSHVPHGREAVNDRYDVSYQYLRGRTAGVLSFRAPRKAGSYDLRMNDTDRNGRETASVTFQVIRPSASSATLRLAKYKYRPGEAIKVWFTASPRFASDAWVGIIPSRVPHGSEEVNDRHDLAYRYLRKRTYGMLEFRAPLAPGLYDLRMHDTDSNGREVHSITFRVKGP